MKEIWSMLLSASASEFEGEGSGWVGGKVSGGTGVGERERLGGGACCARAGCKEDGRQGV